jgi:tetratricopeptide (TPR) repeat protein
VLICCRKSQLAIEYCYRLRERSPDTWILWVHASNAARFSSSIRDVADQLGIVGRDDPKADILQLVKGRLQDPRNGKWLLVLDNADEARYLLQAHDKDPERLKSGGMNVDGKRLFDYLPICSHGSVIVTTRSREMAAELVDDVDIVTVQPMDEDLALSLLVRKLGPQTDGTIVKQLVAALEYMPLAVSQAAAYIKQRGPRSSVKRYLEAFEKSEKSRTCLLTINLREHRRDTEATNSILSTWQISFEHIRQHRRSAADLLSLMSFFDNQGIPESILQVRHQPSSSTDHEPKQARSNGFDSADDSSGSADEDMEEDIITLRNYSFISDSPDGMVFKMHRLVQLATRDWLKLHKQDIYWLEQSLSNLDAAFPNSNFENWTVCRALLPHAKLAFDVRAKTRDACLIWASVSCKAASYMLSQGFATDAGRLASGSMDIRKDLLGEEHSDTLTSMFTFASTYRSQGRWKEAEELQVSAMETTKRVLGEEHPDTLTGMVNLASTYRKQGRWKEAEELQVSVLEAEKRVLGEEHPDTLTGMANLASTYRKQGRWKEAEELQVSVMEAEKRVLGEEHPHTLTGMSNLASTYRKQGRWKEAEELQVSVMEADQRVLGEEHPDTLTGMNDLASTYWSQGRWKEAEELEVSVLEARKRVLGEEHPHTLISMSNLASTYLSQGRWKEAEELQVLVMEANKRVLGEEHPHTLTGMSNLASTYQNQGRWKEAEELQVSVMEARKRVLGEGHPDTLAGMANFAYTLECQGRIIMASLLLRRTINVALEYHGPDYPDIAKWRMALDNI